MNRRFPTIFAHGLSLALAVVLMLVVSSSNAAIILSTDFNSLSAGATNATAVDGVTTGGSWTLTASNQEIQNDQTGNSPAFKALESSAGSNTDGARVDLTSAFSLSSLSGADRFEIDLITGTTNGAGYDRDTFWYLRDGDDNALVTVELDDQNIWVNGTDLGAIVTGNGNTAAVGPTWDSQDINAITMSFSIDSSAELTFEASTANYTRSTTVQLDTNDEIQAFNTRWRNSPIGTYIADLQMATVPEPSTIVLALFGAAGLFMYRLRKQR